MRVADEDDASEDNLGYTRFGLEQHHNHFFKLVHKTHMSKLRDSGFHATLRIEPHLHNLKVFGHRLLTIANLIARNTGQDLDIDGIAAA
jgi:hypothetical protein